MMSSRRKPQHEESESLSESSVGELASSFVKSLLKLKSFKQGFSMTETGEVRVWENVSSEASAFAVAALASAFPQKRIWLLADQARLQERMESELRIWSDRRPLHLPKISLSGEAALVDPELQSQRFAVLECLTESDQKKDFHQIVILSEDQWEELVPSPSQLKKLQQQFKTGTDYDLDQVLESALQAGFEKVPFVSERGQIAKRGGILDIFTWLGETPLRLEFFGDTLDSIRTLDIHSQTSIQRKDSVHLIFEANETSEVSLPLREWVRKEDVIIKLSDEVWSSPFSSQRCFQISTTSLTSEGEENFEVAMYPSPLGSSVAGDFVVQEAKRQEFKRQIEAWRHEKWKVLMVFHQKAELERFEELIGKEWFEASEVETCFHFLPHGFTAPFAKKAVISVSEILGRHVPTRRLKGTKLDETTVLRQAREHLRELKVGDLVVHTDYGIGRYDGIEVRGGNVHEEVMVIRFADQAKAFVPLGQSHLISRYVGIGGKAPTLSKLGDSRWIKTRQQTEKSVEQFAARMLSTAAQRQNLIGLEHAPDNRWQHEFEESFVYRETVDQLRAVEEIKRDMESTKPMDRLLCGDVGFGKTEVAIRAAFKAVMSGTQVAVLVPTTVLAQQHWQTFRERMSDYPVRVEMLCRLTPPKKEKEILKGIQDGSVDIVVGTHRVISKDVRFSKLGLAIVDEEQRFGVRHKEKFKELFKLVDVLTLSATPIPRTLYLSLLGMRDMSTLDTPPSNRHPVQTSVIGYDERVIRDSIDQELDRGGQVFFLHNRVATIENMREKLSKLCPRARVLIGHGQMEAEDLEKVMEQFIAGEADVLVCTTIIESGVDIPNANTIIIDRADRFGLADLYQLRGRVGRGGEKAHAILMLPRDIITVGDARKRVNAIKQYTALGSGFKIAMRDLEIRGAGNLLGTEQSGHIVAVGFDLYCQMLKSATAKLQGQNLAIPMDVSLNIDFVCMNEASWIQSKSATDTKRVTAATAHRPPDRQKLVISKETRIPVFLPTQYMQEPRLRITAYRQLGEVLTKKELYELKESWVDQFGPLPEEVEHLITCAEIRLAASKAKISSVEIKGGKLILQKNGQFLLIGGKFPRLTGLTAPLQLADALKLLKSL